MEPKSSFRHSQVSATCPYPYTKPHQSSSCPPSHFSKIHFNIIFPSTSSSFKLLLLSVVPTKILCAPFFSSIRAMCHAHLIFLDLITQIIFGEKDHKAPRYVVFSTLWYLVLLSPDRLLSNTLRLCSSLNVRDQASHPYKTSVKIIALYILIFIFLGSKLEDIRSSTEWQQAFPDFILFFIPSRMEFCRIGDVLKYQNCSKLSENIFSVYNWHQIAPNYIHTTQS